MNSNGYKFQLLEVVVIMPCGSAFPLSICSLPGHHLELEIPEHRGPCGEDADSSGGESFALSRARFSDKCGYVSLLTISSLLPTCLLTLTWNFCFILATILLIIIEGSFYLPHSILFFQLSGSSA